MLKISARTTALCSSLPTNGTCSSSGCLRFSAWYGKPPSLRVRLHSSPFRAQSTDTSRFESIQLCFFAWFAAPPTIAPFQFPKNLQVDQRISVLCSISVGDRPVQFSWLKDGSMMAGVSFPNMRIVDNAEFSTLLIDPITLDSAGNYTCSVTNTAGHTSFTASLVVHGKWSSSFFSLILVRYNWSTPF